MVIKSLSIIKDKLFYSLLSHSGQFGVYHDASAILTYYDFLVHLDLHLLLRRDAVEAASTGIALYVYDAETVAGVVTDALEGFECALVDARLYLLGLYAQTLFVLFGFRYDFVKLRFLFFKNVLAVGKTLFGSDNVVVFSVYGTGILVEVLFAKLDFKCLELNFFRQEVKLAVVSYIVKLLFVARYL